MVTKVFPNAPQKLVQKLVKFRFMAKIGLTDSVLKIFNRLLLKKNLLERLHTTSLLQKNAFITDGYITEFGL